MNKVILNIKNKDEFSTSGLFLIDNDEYILARVNSDHQILVCLKDGRSWRYDEFLSNDITSDEIEQYISDDFDDEKTLFEYLGNKQITISDE